MQNVFVDEQSSRARRGVLGVVVVQFPALDLNRARFDLRDRMVWRGVGPRYNSRHPALPHRLPATIQDRAHAKRPTPLATSINRRSFLAATAATGLAVAARAADAERKLRVAVIGHTGRGDYGHGINMMWLSVPETEVVAVADADSTGLAAALKKLHVSQGFADYRQMLAQTKPDIVAIGMRHIDQHRDAALAVAEAGVRGIYMEKPLCRTPAEADEIVSACERSNVKLALAYAIVIIRCCRSLHS